MNTNPTDDPKIKPFDTVMMLTIFAVVLAVITGIAGFFDFHQNKNRHQAETSLMVLSSKMEHYYRQNQTYQGASLQGLDASDRVKGYQLAISDATAASYTLKAIPQGHQARLDRPCGTLTLNQFGIKGNTGQNYPQQCWN